MNEVYEEAEKELRDRMRKLVEARKKASEEVAKRKKHYVESKEYRRQRSYRS